MEKSLQQHRVVFWWVLKALAHGVLLAYSRYRGTRRRIPNLDRSSIASASNVFQTSRRLMRPLHPLILSIHCCREREDKGEGGGKEGASHHPAKARSCLQLLPNPRSTSRSEPILFLFLSRITCSVTDINRPRYRLIPLQPALRPQAWHRQRVECSRTTSSWKTSSPASPIHAVSSSSSACPGSGKHSSSAPRRSSAFCSVAQRNWPSHQAALVAGRSPTTKSFRSTGSDKTQSLLEKYISWCHSWTDPT